MVQFGNECKASRVDMQQNLSLINYNKKIPNFAVIFKPKLRFSRGESLFGIGDSLVRCCIDV